MHHTKQEEEEEDHFLSLSFSRVWKGARVVCVYVCVPLIRHTALRFWRTDV